MTPEDRKGAGNADAAGQTLMALVNETYARIPSTESIADTRKQIFLVHVEKDKATLLHPDAPPEMLALLNSPRYDLHHNIAASKKTGDSYSCISNQSPHARLLIINSSTRFGLTNRQRELSFLYDHELGHAIIANAYYSPPSASLTAINKGECIADAYAAIRLYQRFGAAAADVRALACARAFNFVFHDVKTHFTAPVLEKVVTQSASIDYTALTPQETMDLARELALLHAPETPKTARLAQGFNGMMKTVDKSNPDSLIKFAHGLLKTSSPQVFLFGSTALSALLSGQMKWHGKPARLEGPQWEAVREKLALRMEDYETEGDRFGLKARRRKAYAPSAPVSGVFPAP